jgi:UDP-N-acetylglucosamine 2-epimerase (non-hydrolysing)
MKIASVVRALDAHNASSTGNEIESKIVHTGQHYDYEMSRVFFEDLALPEPDAYLGIGSGTHAEQTGRAMIELERVFVEWRPDLVVVVGDVNSTLAGALAAAKLHIPVAHVEAGLRSFDRQMPEEINRLLTDAISDYLFTPSPDADRNLMNEGVAKDRIFFVGNVMIDTLLLSRKKAAEKTILTDLRLVEGGYCVLTLHRPENVDRDDKLAGIGLALNEISQGVPVVFPCHPRTKGTIGRFGLAHLFGTDTGEEKRNLGMPAIRTINPLGYLDFLQLEAKAAFVLTDSGGIQEETTVLGVPCLTLRATTERPVTVSEGTNTVVGAQTQDIIRAALGVLNGKRKKGKRPKLWDGKAAQRIVAILAKRTRETISLDPRIGPDH